MRTIAEAQSGIRGFWTQPLLRNLSDQNLINEETHFEKSVQLIRAHYYFTAINPQLLIFVLEKHGMKITSEVTDVLRTLEGPRTNEEDAIRITAECLRNVWLRPWLVEQKIFVLDQLLSTLITGRMGLIVLKKLWYRLDALLQIAPLHHDELLRQIAIWQKMKIREKAI